MLRKLVVGFIQANCYVLACDETREGLVIDPGDEVSRIMKQIEKDGLKIRTILITHGHVDHIGGAQGLKEKTGAPVWIHELDAKALPFEPDGLLEDGQELAIGKVKVSVIHTPGHSPGGVSFHAPGAVFTGDTLFEGSIGRTDLRGGSHKTLIQSVVKRIFPLGDELRVYPGHGPRSTIGEERRHNPFFS
ncbi:MAG: MBL fold metallo-hydrolase [Pseudomonadota bacterium]